MNKSEDIAKNIRNTFLYKIKEPVVLKKYLFKNINDNKWHCLTWNKYKWLKVLGNEKYKITFGKKLSSSEPLDNPQWEDQNFKREMSYEDMLKWEEGIANFVTDCKTYISQKEYWAYLDYLYLSTLPDQTILNENISWEVLGFPEVKAKDCTLWIGTTGANTPCHIDTYGANIVCQISGKKRWTMFPKSQTPYMYPTRVPFEESSIYSAAGFPYPNMDKFYNLYQTTPYIITLEAGDVLLVPKHWWHFVENLEFSVTINSWIPFPDDHHDRLKESIVTYQVGNFCQSLSSISLLKSILVTNAIDIATSSSSELLDSFISNIHNYGQESGCENKSKIASKEILHTVNDSFDSLFLSIDKYPFSTYISMVKMQPVSVKSVKRPGSNYDDYIKTLVKCFTDERVVDILKIVIDENIKAFKD